MRGNRHVTPAVGVQLECSSVSRELAIRTSPARHIRRIIFESLNQVASTSISSILAQSSRRCRRPSVWSSASSCHGLGMCALKVRTVGNTYVNDQRRESPPCLRRLGVGSEQPRSPFGRIPALIQRWLERLESGVWRRLGWVACGALSVRRSARTSSCAAIRAAERTPSLDRAHAMRDHLTHRALRVTLRPIPSGGLLNGDAHTAWFQTLAGRWPHEELAHLRPFPARQTAASPLPFQWPWHSDPDTAKPRLD